MKKYVSQQVEVVRVCAYCDYECDYQGKAICRWGQVDIWSCPTHGKFEELDSPMKNRGDQIR